MCIIPGSAIKVVSVSHGRQSLPRKSGNKLPERSSATAGGSRGKRSIVAALADSLGHDYKVSRLKHLHSESMEVEHVDLRDDSDRARENVSDGSGGCSVNSETSVRRLRAPCKKGSLNHRTKESKISTARTECD